MYSSVCIFIYIYIYIHTYIHMHLPACRPRTPRTAPTASSGAGGGGERYDGVRNVTKTSRTLKIQFILTKQTEH